MFHEIFVPVSRVNISFTENRTGETIKVNADSGKSILDVAIELDVDIEGNPSRANSMNVFDSK